MEESFFKNGSQLSGVTCSSERAGEFFAAACNAFTAARVPKKGAKPSGDLPLYAPPKKVDWF